MTTEQLYELYLQHPSIQTDTRKLKTGDLFFALKGPSFNGNSFALNALEKGASYAIVDEEISNLDGRILKVDNVLESLQLLAKYHREQFNIPFIAITGSNGKTTTKELVNAVLASHFTTYTTKGNLNNHIGIPLTLLSIGKDAQMAVIEMGANHQKEIEGYCKFTEPTHGIITNCGKAHLEGFGGIEGVKKGKGELFDYLRDHQRTAFINNDFDYLIEMSKGIPNVITYGTSDADVVGKVIKPGEFLSCEINTNDGNFHVNTHLVGAYNLPNILCAFAIGRHFGVPVDKIVSALEDYHPDNSRSQMVRIGSNHIIMDAYNANPTSMRMAIENFAQLNAPGKVLILGGMMELGEESVLEHQELIALIENYNWDDVALIGGDFNKVSHRYKYFEDTAQAKSWFNELSFTNSYFLIKGSRSIQLEKLVATN